jgi:hypothetical protein
MTRDDIVRMAREAGWRVDSEGEVLEGDGWHIQTDIVERFAELVAAAERERIKWDTIHSCHPECDKPVCVAIRKAVAEEREACAKLAYEVTSYEGIADAIRARGAP